MEITRDSQLLQFNLDQPKQLSSLSFNTVNQQHSPLPYDTKKSTPASGNYFRTPFKPKLLKPSPRSQLGVPTKKVYEGDPAKFYYSTIGNANFVRGNQFSVLYPYKKKTEFVESVSIPAVVPDENGPVDYLGNDAKIVMRNNDPFYPFPSQHLYKDKSYWSYNHDKQYLAGQPIYNYPHGKMEGGDRGRYLGAESYNPYLVEGFSMPSCSRQDSIWIILAMIAFIIALYMAFSLYKK